MEDSKETSKLFWEKGVYLTIISSVRNHNKLPVLGLSKQSMNRYVSRLKKEGLIRKIGYATWELKQVNKEVNTPPKTSLTSKQVRGHGFIWRLVFPRGLSSSFLVQFLSQTGIAYNYSKSNVLRFKYQGYECWWGKSSLVLYCPEESSFYADSAEESKNLCFYEVASIIKELEKGINRSLRCGTQYILKLCRQHYSDIDNRLAKERIKEGKPLHISTDVGEWLLVDLSQGLPELETVHPKTALKDMDEVIMPFFNDIKLNPSPLPSEMWRILAAEVTNWEKYAVNMNTHVEAVKSLSEGVKELRSTISELKGEEPVESLGKGLLGSRGEETELWRWMKSRGKK
jgi:hypothetical protein